MSDVVKKEVDKALREYLEAAHNYHGLLDKYFGGGGGIPDVLPVLAYEEAKAAIKEIDEAEAKVTKARKKWETLINL